CRSPGAPRKNSVCHRGNPGDEDCGPRNRCRKWPENRIEPGLRRNYSHIPFQGCDLVRLLKFFYRFVRLVSPPRGSGPYLLGPVAPLITASMNVRPKSTPAIGCASSSLFSRWRTAQSTSNATKTTNAFHPCPRS